MALQASTRQFFAHGRTFISIFTGRDSFMSPSFSTIPEDDIVKETFSKQQAQFRGYLKELEGVRIPLDPSDEKAVKEYADSIKNIRQKVGISSIPEKLGGLLDSAAEDSEDLRTFLNHAQSVRIELGIEDKLGVEPLLFAALDAVEKKLGKPLQAGDAAGAAAFQEQIQSLNEKLGLKESDFGKIESNLDLEIAKSEVQSFRNEALAIMETYRKRDGLENVKVDLQSLEPHAYL